MYLFKTIHICGVLVWFAGLMTSLHVLAAYARTASESRGDFGGLSGRVGMVMDLGATATLTAGIALVAGPYKELLKNGSLHAKLALVVVVLGLHGMVRVRLAQFKRDDVEALPGWLAPSVGFSVLVSVALITMRPI